MNRPTRYMLFVCLLVSVAVSGQKISVKTGSMDVLKGVKSYSIEFTYDSMIVGNFVPEDQFLNEKQTTWEVRQPGKGKEFVEMWKDDRRKMYEPTFIGAFEDYSGLRVKDANAKYTIIFKTTRTEGGWDMGLAEYPGEIYGELRVVESANHSNVIAVISFLKFIGKYRYGGDFQMTRRIRSAYLEAGQALGAFIRKKTK